jgi:ABC-2 type transport system permease protein
VRLIWAVARQAWVGRRRAVSAWAAALLGLCGLQLAAYPSIRGSADELARLVDRYPPALREAFGLDAYTTGAGFLHAELFSVLAPLVLIGAAVSAGAGGTAAEEATGTADLIFTGAANRAQVLAGKALAMLAAVVAVAGSMLLVLAVGTRLVDLSVPFTRLLAATTMTAMLAGVFGALAVLVGAATGQRAAATAAGIGAAVLAFVISVLAPLASWLEPFRPLSPFTWDITGRPVMSGLDVGGAVTSVTVTVALLSVAAFALTRRDIRCR